MFKDSPEGQTHCHICPYCEHTGKNCFIENNSEGLVYQCSEFKEKVTTPAKSGGKK